MVAMLPSVFVVFLIQCIYPWHQQLADCRANKNFNWVFKIAAIDLVVNLTLATGWSLWVDWYVAQMLNVVKLDRKRVEPGTYTREVTYTISTILCGVFWECAYLKAIAA